MVQDGQEMFKEMSGNVRKCSGYSQEMSGSGLEMSQNGQGNVKKWSEMVRIMSKIGKNTFVSKVQVTRIYKFHPLSQLAHTFT